MQGCGYSVRTVTRPASVSAVELAGALEPSTCQRVGKGVRINQGVLGQPGVAAEHATMAAAARELL